jgi:hypothetical protein
VLSRARCRAGLGWPSPLVCVHAVRRLRRLCRLCPSVPPVPPSSLSCEARSACAAVNGQPEALVNRVGAQRPWGQGQIAASSEPEPPVPDCWRCWCRRRILLFARWALLAGWWWCCCHLAGPAVGVAAGTTTPAWRGTGTQHRTPASTGRPEGGRGRALHGLEVALAHDLPESQWPGAPVGSGPGPGPGLNGVSGPLQPQLLLHGTVCW